MKNIFHTGNTLSFGSCLVLLAFNLIITWTTAGHASADVLSGLVFEAGTLSERDTGAVSIIDSSALEIPTRERSGFAWAADGSGNGMQAQVSFDPATESAIVRSLAGIRATELEKGPYAPDLVQQLLILARLHQRTGEHAKALEEAARADQISRIVFGLDAPEQVAAIELSIESYLALPDYQRALEQQQALVHLHQSHYGSDAPETVPRLIMLGDMYFAAFERNFYKLGGGAGLKLVQGQETGYADPSELSPEQMTFVWLRQARSHYVTAINILLARQDYFNPVLLNLESSVVEILFLQAHQRELENEPDFFMRARDDTMRLQLDFKYRVEKNPFYLDGEKALLRMLSYQTSNPDATPAQIAGTMLQLGDWHYLFNRPAESREMYAKARDFLLANAVSEAELAMLLNPPLPVQLPTFFNPPQKLKASIEGVLQPRLAGQLDVTFELGKYGRATDIEVRDTSLNAEGRIEGRLRKMLRNVLFRPRVPRDDEPESREYHLLYSFAQY